MTSSDTNSSSPCYQFENNRIHQGTNWLPCGPWESGGPVLSCCKVNDYCMSDGICHYTHSLNGGSGYYQGSCTDSNYQAGICPHRCNDQPFPDVKYNVGLDQWQCCGENSDGGVSCASPTTNEFFVAPVPSELVTTASAGQTTLPSSSSSSQSSSATSATTSTSAPATSTAAASTGLSTGAIAGIAVAAVVIGLVALGALIYFLMRKQRRRKAAAPGELANNEVQQDPKAGQAQNGWQAPTEADSTQLHELGMPQHKMYFDHAKQQWLYEQPAKSGLLRHPTEMSADQVFRKGHPRHPAELSAETRPVEAPGHER